MLKNLSVCLLSLFANLLFSQQEDATYHCENSQMESIDISFKAGKAQIKRTSKNAKSSKDWVLSGFVAFDDSPREPLRYVYSLPESGKKLDLRKSFEFREQFFRELKPQQLRMMLIQEGEILTGWKCFYGGAALSVRMLESPADSALADKLFITRAIKGVLAEDMLAEESLGMLIQTIERYGLWGVTPASVFQPVVYLTPPMVKQIESRLSDRGKLTWQLILKSVTYESVPAIQRWIFWMNLAARGNNEAVRAGVRNFVNSPLYRDKNMQEFVQRETKAAIQGVSSDRFKQILGELKRENEKKFLENIYNKKTN